jgi:hypothetical protein
VAVVQQLL